MSENEMTLEQLREAERIAREYAAGRATRTAAAIAEAEERLKDAKARLAESIERLPAAMAETAIGDENWPPKRLAGFRKTMDKDRVTIADSELLLEGLKALRKRDFIGEVPVTRACLAREAYERQLRNAERAAQLAARCF